MNSNRHKNAPRRVVTVLPSRGLRDDVQAVCRAIEPACAITDVSSVTDAVLVLLSEPVDLLVVDMALTGDMRGVLNHHVRRSAPKGKMALFGTDAPSGSTAITEFAPVHSWLDMEATLHCLFDEQQV